MLNSLLLGVYVNRFVFLVVHSAAAVGIDEFDKRVVYRNVLRPSGLPEEYSKYNAVGIEQSNKVDSLNLSVAVSVALYKLYTSN